MNQSKWKPITLFIAFFVCILCLVWNASPYIPGPGINHLTHDAFHTYSECIETGNVTNWHSVLFMYECISLRNFIHVVTGFKLTGPEVLCVVWWVLSIMMVASMALIGCRFCRVNKWLAFPFLLCVYISLIPTSQLYRVGLDYYFTCILWMLIAVITELYHSYGQKKWWLYLILAVVLLFHMIAYRRNAVLLAPMVILFLLYNVAWFKALRIRNKVTCWIGIVFAFVIIAFSWESVIPDVEKRHPVTPMMESEVRIAAILRGETDAFRRHGFYVKKYGGYADTKNVADKAISAYWFGQTFSTEQKWSSYKDIYINEWKTNTETMLAAWVIQRIQFYSGGHNFPFLKNAVEKRYPIIKENKHAWETPGPLVHDSPLKRIFWLCFTPICFLIAVYIGKKGIVDSNVGVIISLCSCSSFLYAISYIIVVPTSDARYLAPSYMLALFSVSMLGVALLTALVKRCKFALCNVR